MDLHDISSPDYRFWYGYKFLDHREKYIETGDTNQLRLMLKCIVYAPN